MNRTAFIGTNLYYSQEFVDDRIKELNEQQQEIEKLNNIINKAIEYTEIQIEDEYEYHGLMYHNDEKDKLLNILKGDDKEIIEEDKKIEKIRPTSLKGIDDLDEKIEIAHIDTVNAMDKINEIIDKINGVNKE